VNFAKFKEKFETEILPSQPSYIRRGQALMNYLYDIWPEEWHRISQGESKNDCYYVDSRVTNTLVQLEKDWYNYPN